MNSNPTGEPQSGSPAYGREQAWKLLTEWTQSESLRKHALAVEACVTACGEAEADRLGTRWRRARGLRQPLHHHRPAPRLRLRAPPHRRRAPLRRRARTRAPRLAAGAAHRHPRPRAILRRSARHASRQSLSSPATSWPDSSPPAPSSSPPKPSPTSKCPACAKK